MSRAKVLPRWLRGSSAVKPCPLSHRKLKALALLVQQHPVQSMTVLV